MSAIERLLRPEKVPASLQEIDSGALRLPDAFAAAYEKLIDRNGLRHLATSRTEKDSPTGGISKEETDKHFAQQFDNSAARAQLALLNPTGEIGHISDALITALSGNALCITDAPCGAGAATYALLCSIAELRAQSVLPRIRLDVRLIGGEISQYAREYAEEVLCEIRPFLESQAIYVEAEFRDWDVTCDLSTADLNNAVARASAVASKRLLVIANFSGFLKLPGKLKDASPQIEELFRYASGKGNVAIWLEPQVKFAVSDEGLLSSIKRWATDKWKHFIQTTPYSTTDVQFRSTLTPHRLRPIRLAVMRLNLDRAR